MSKETACLVKDLLETQDVILTTVRHPQTTRHVPKVLQLTISKKPKCLTHLNISGKIHNRLHGYFKTNKPFVRVDKISGTTPFLPGKCTTFFLHFLNIRIATSTLPLDCLQ